MSAPEIKLSSDEYISRYFVCTRSKSLFKDAILRQICEMDICREIVVEFGLQLT
jgi:hypothetical protein